MQQMERIRDYRDIEIGIKRLIEIDPRLEELAEKAGAIPLRLELSGFMSLMRIITGQQVSLASAHAIFGRLEARINPLSPSTFLNAGEEAWREIGLSRPKQTSMKCLSEAILSGELVLEKVIDLPAETAIDTLTALKGIGPWTAEVYLLFCAGYPDVFPAGDRALQISVGEGLGYDGALTEKDLREVARIWQPYRSIASRLFWAYYRVLKSGRDAIPL